MRFGDLRVDLVPAGRFRLDGGSMFGIVPKVLWSRVRAADEKNRIELAANCLLIRDGRRNILVETGMGEKWSEKEREIYAVRSEGGVLGELGRRGVEAASIDTVILTHLHFDHAGGSTISDAEGRLVPAFPNATYWVQATEWEFATHLNERTRASYLARDFEPLQRDGRLRLIEGEVEVIPGLSLLPLPGHTPGMQGILMKGGGRTALFPADLVPTTAHVPIPYIMGFDSFPLTTLETKKRILATALRERWQLILVHETEHPVGTLREEGGRMAFEPSVEER
ncbi:MAG TPA: MBL fold metallo-hydrolase [Candidatus Polarisedimenticolia bacterium]|nr:MBL fold metallo-hydrolase [Candidatus Polarisedimenticolia bacterium]